LGDLNAAGALRALRVSGQRDIFLVVRLSEDRKRDMLDGLKEEGGTNTPLRVSAPGIKRGGANGGEVWECQRGAKRERESTAAAPKPPGKRGGGLLHGLPAVREPLKVSCPFRFTITHDGETIVVKIKESVLADGHNHSTDCPARFVSEWVRDLIAMEFAENAEVTAEHLHKIILQAAQQLAVIGSGLTDYKAVREAQAAKKLTPSREELIQMKDVNSILAKLRREGNSLATNNLAPSYVVASLTTSPSLSPTRRGTQNGLCGDVSLCGCPSFLLLRRPHRNWCLLCAFRAQRSPTSLPLR